MEDLRLPEVCAVIGDGNAQHVAVGRIENNEIQYHPYLIPEDVELKDMDAFAYGDSVQRDVKNRSGVLFV